MGRYVMDSEAKTLLLRLGTANKLGAQCIAARRITITLFLYIKNHLLISSNLLSRIRTVIYDSPVFSI